MRPRRAHMGLCYSLRPLLFGDPQDTPCEASEPLAEGARPGPAPASNPAAGREAAWAPLPRGSGGSVACAQPKADLKRERQRRPDQLRAEEREAEKEARKVSRNIDRMLREQKRDLQQTHRLLLLGRCGWRVARASSGRAVPAPPRGAHQASTSGRGGPLSSPRRVGDARRANPGRSVSLKSCAE